MDPKILSGLKAEKYRHPQEVNAFEKLKDTTGFQKIVSKFHEIGLEQNLKWHYRSSCVKVTDNNFRHLLYLSNKACEILQVEKQPELFIMRSENLEGISIGADDPMIILSTEAVGKLSSQELLFILGREMAHIDHQHTLYKEIGLIFPELIEAFSVVTLGLSSLLSAGLKYALYHWEMTSELTADRGGLLTCQDKMACMSFLAKVAGWPESHWSSINLKEFANQVTSFQASSQKSLDKVINYMVGTSTHAIARAKELSSWIEGGEYDFLVHESKSIH